GREWVRLMLLSNRSHRRRLSCRLTQVWLTALFLSAASGPLAAQDEEPIEDDEPTEATGEEETGEPAMTPDDVDAMAVDEVSGSEAAPAGEASGSTEMVVELSVRGNAKVESDAILALL